MSGNKFGSSVYHASEETSMGSYYYTAEDRAFTDAVALELRDRLVHNPAAKRGHRWRMDGEPITWQKLFWWIQEEGDWVQRAEISAKYPAAWRKIGNWIPFQGFLKLLAERLAHWKGADLPF